MSAHLRSTLPKNALTGALLMLMSTLCITLVPSAAHATSSSANTQPAATRSGMVRGTAAATSAAASTSLSHDSLSRNRRTSSLALRPGQLVASTGTAENVVRPPISIGAAAVPPSHARLLRLHGARIVAARSARIVAARNTRIVAARGARIVAAAGAQRGKPYRRGAQGPAAFDCSGLAGYAYRAVHIRLPRTANEQYDAARPINPGAARPGDLVFWVSGGHAYHVAVYAGAGRVWHAPKPGDRVRLAAIWSAGEVRFGRVAP